MTKSVTLTRRANGGPTASPWKTKIFQKSVKGVGIATTGQGYNNCYY